METMIITPKPSDPEIVLLSKELERRNFTVNYLIPSEVKVKINIESFKEQFINLEPKRILVRGFGADATKKIFFRLDLLSAIEEYGIRLINSREALEIASDKFLSSIFLENANIATPKTVICEDPEDALDSFEELGGDVVLKPLFGSKGIGITRLNDKAFAENVIYTLAELNEVFYLQEFIPHYNRDIRILVLGDKALAGMYRVGSDWKTNIHAGARSEPLELTEELKELAMKASHAVKTDIAGVDIIESENGYYVLEVNSIPGFTALQKVTDINLVEEIINFFLDETI
ncbi:MAG: RimK family alpha-L-glutamate ligase [Promethearchaeota archaeon]|nr:MAG: RimK family alpha-L-glutamate ligase [Candidatus Lokiarchaeota archaeon]